MCRCRILVCSLSSRGPEHSYKQLWGGVGSVGDVPAAFFLSMPLPTQLSAAVTTVGSEKPSTRFTVFSIHGFSSSSSLLDSAIAAGGPSHSARTCRGIRQENDRLILKKRIISPSFWCLFS